MLLPDPTTILLRRPMLSVLEGMYLFARMLGLEGIMKMINTTELSSYSVCCRE